jgi:hypothetical protein
MKKLCKYKKDELKKEISQVVEFVKKPKYICKKCLRVSSESKMLCKSEKISNI